MFSCCFISFAPLISHYFSAKLLDASAAAACSSLWVYCWKEGNPTNNLRSMWFLFLRFFIFPSYVSLSSLLFPPNFFRGKLNNNFHSHFIWRVYWRRQVFWWEFMNGFEYYECLSWYRSFSWHHQTRKYNNIQRKWKIIRYNLLQFFSMIIKMLADVGRWKRKRKEKQRKLERETRLFRYSSNLLTPSIVYITHRYSAKFLDAIYLGCLPFSVHRFLSHSLVSLTHLK